MYLRAAMLAAGLPALAWGYHALRARAHVRMRPRLPASARVLVFDLDHTLARYNVRPLYELVHRCAARFLVEELGYDASLLQPYDHAWPAFKGLVLDLATGDLLLLDETGAVARARHGAGPAAALDASQLAARYGAPGRRWRGADALLGGATRGDRYFALCTGYDVGLQLLCCQLVDLADAAAKASGNPPAYGFQDDLLAAITACFRQPAFAGGTGGFFCSLRADPHRYLRPRSAMGAWLRSVRSEGVRVAVVTNSHADFAAFTMRTAFGSVEAACCDLIIADARKPSWFTREGPLQRVAWSEAREATGLSESTAGEPLGAHPELPCEHMLTGGSAAALESLFGCSGEAIVYLGDTCFGEIAPAAARGWWPVAVVEEMEGGEVAQPSEWGGSFWAAPPAGTSAGATPQSWLGSAFKASARMAVADIDALVAGVGPCWRRPGQ